MDSPSYIHSILSFYSNTTSPPSPFYSNTSITAPPLSLSYSSSISPLFPSYDSPFYSTTHNTNTIPSPNHFYTNETSTPNLSLSQNYSPLSASCYNLYGSENTGNSGSDIPIFDGKEDAYWWILCTEKYFKARGISEAAKMTETAKAMRGQAFKWWQGWSQRHPSTEWDEFTNYFLWCFKPEWHHLLPIYAKEESDYALPTLEDEKDLEEQLDEEEPEPAPEFLISDKELAEEAVIFVGQEPLSNSSNYDHSQEPVEQLDEKEQEREPEEQRDCDGKKPDLDEFHRAGNFSITDDPIPIPATPLIPTPFPKSVLQLEQIEMKVVPSQAPQQKLHTTRKNIKYTNPAPTPPPPKPPELGSVKGRNGSLLVAMFSPKHKLAALPPLNRISWPPPVYQSSSLNKVFLLPPPPKPPYQKFHDTVIDIEIQLHQTHTAPFDYLILEFPNQKHSEPSDHIFFDAAQSQSCVKNTICVLGKEPLVSRHVSHKKSLDTPHKPPLSTNSQNLRQLSHIFKIENQLENASASHASVVHAFSKGPISGQNSFHSPFQLLLPQLLQVNDGKQIPIFMTPRALNESVYSIVGKENCSSVSFVLNLEHSHIPCHMFALCQDWLINVPTPINFFVILHNQLLHSMSCNMLSLHAQLDACTTSTREFFSKSVRIEHWDPGGQVAPTKTWTIRAAGCAFFPVRLLYQLKFGRGQQWDLGGYLDSLTLIRSSQFKHWDPGENFVTTLASSLQFKQWDPGKIFPCTIFFNLEDKVVVKGNGM